MAMFKSRTSFVHTSLCNFSASMSRKACSSGVGAEAGQRRRSPRISALNSCSKSKNHHQQQQQKRRNLEDAAAVAAALPPLSKLTKQVWKGRDTTPQNGDCVLEWRSLKEHPKHDDGDDISVKTNGNALVMPEKHVLELVLDTLQRRDTYEIFAQPVDPDEVEDYYEIIKEPMDFGTMRAKLHEGMYQNLQQFEHDVFLIPENAMHFNSSSTTYFRQARAIHELATKVFRVLKTSPENFISEFSGTRRRSMRKALSESKSSPPPRRPPPSTSQTSTGDGRRDTYSRKEDKKEEVSTFLSSSKTLALMNQGDISYEDSLMSYVKDLGATAAMVAKRKLLGEHVSNSSGARKRSWCGAAPAAASAAAPKEFKTFRDFAQAGCNSNPFVVVKASNKTDLTRDGDEAKLRNSNNNTSTGTRKKDKVRDVNCSSRPVILALENHHSEFKTRNKRSCNSVCNQPPPPPQQQQHKALPLVPHFNQPAQQQHKALPLVSHFTFDLPFFKARLNQMTKGDRSIQR